MEEKRKMCVRRGEKNRKETENCKGMIVVAVCFQHEEMN